MLNKIILFTFILLLTSAGYADGVEQNNRTVCSNPRPAVCTMDYTPVCGLSKDKTVKTYSNGCGACSNPNVISYVPQACPERILSADELSQLFSGNTYKASIPSRNIQMTVYVDPDGTMRGMQGGHKFTSKWAINDKDEICVSYRDKMSCRIVIEDNGVYKKYKINDKGEKVLLVIYQSFTPGNINHY